jgi:hypothetical protein
VDASISSTRTTGQWRSPASASRIVRRESLVGADRQRQVVRRATRPSLPTSAARVVVDDGGAALGITLLPVADRRRRTILGDRNADKRDTLTGTSAGGLIDAGAAGHGARGDQRTG